MYKNMFKRAWLSIKRKPSRSIILGLLFFAMSNLILSGIIIKSAVNTSTEYAKSSIESTVTLQADMSKLRESMGSNMPSPDSDSSDSSSRPKFTRPSVKKSTADDVSESEYVKDYTYSISSSANANDLTAVETSSSKSGGFGPMMGGGGPGGFGFDQNSGDFPIYGVNSYAFISQVQDKTMSIKDGEYFDEDDTDSAIISVDLAETNNLSVGDTITLINTDTDAENTVKIIGTYDVSSNNFNANTIYMNVDTAAKFLSDEDYNDGAYSVENVRYTLTSGEVADAFISEVETKHPELAEDNISATVDTSTYDQMVGPIESVGGFATTILIIVVIASVIIITLIVTINVKDRRYEMGVLLSLGAKRITILGQIFCELILVSTIAFALSTVTSTFLAKAMGQGILDSQIASAQTEKANNFGRPTTGPGGNFPSRSSSSKGDMPSGDFNPGNSGGGRPGSQSNVEVIDEIDISAQPIDFLLLFVCGYLIIIVALLIPSVNIIRYQPKQILQGKE